MIRVLALLMTLATPSFAQEVGQAPGVVLRALDKVTGDVRDLEMPVGTSVKYGNILLTTGECRYPTRDRAGNAYAFLEIRDLRNDTVAFNGWMIASAPALNALDHARYDVWVLRCSR